MTKTKIEFIFSQKGMTREQVRKKVVEKFLEERSGPAKDETYNRYDYLVEKTDGGNVILVRPANLKLGFDFRIDVDSMTFRKKSHAPTHIDILEDLKNKRAKDAEFEAVVRKAIIKVNEMYDPEELLPEINDKEIGFPVELILKISKWFAIEQDIRYWNGWGRNKQVLWLELMNYFNYNYIPVDSGFKFVDSTGNILTEKKAIAVMNNSKQQSLL